MLLSSIVSALALVASVSAENRSKRTKEHGRRAVAHRGINATHIEKRGIVGKGTWYDVETGDQVSCGGFHYNNDWLVALNEAQMGSGSPAPLCGKTIWIEWKGKRVTGIPILDTCPAWSCDTGYGHIDLSKGLFAELEDWGVGELKGLLWDFEDGSGGGGGGSWNGGNGNNGGKQWEQPAPEQKWEQPPPENKWEQPPAPAWTPPPTPPQEQHAADQPGIMAAAEVEPTPTTTTTTTIPMIVYVATPTVTATATTTTAAFATGVVPPPVPAPANMVGDDGPPATGNEGNDEAAAAALRDSIVIKGPDGGVDGANNGNLGALTSLVSRVGAILVTAALGAAHA